MSRSRKGPVTIRKPDPRTGEVREEVVPADHFRAKLPREPELDISRIGIPRPGELPLQTGWGVLYMHDYREQLIVYWEAHARCLTREERTAISEGTSSILRPSEFPPLWEKGDRLEVASNLTAEVEGIERTLKGHRTLLLVQDFRPFHLKQTPSSSTPPVTDEYGDPVPPDAESIEAARIDGAYTSSHALAVPDSGEEISDDLHRRLHGEALAANAAKAMKQRKNHDKFHFERRLIEARKKNWRSTVRYLEREKTRRNKRKRAA